MLGMLAYNAKHYKEARSQGISASHFFTRLRVKAQAMIVGALAIGVGYSIINDYYLHPKTEEELHEKYRYHGPDRK